METRKKRRVSPDNEILSLIPGDSSNKKKKRIHDNESRRGPANNDVPLTNVLLSFPPHTRDMVNAFIRESKDDDPPVVIMWRNVHNFVQSIPAVADVPSPAWIPNINPTVDEFKDAILGYLRIQGAALPMHHGVLPCTAAQSCQVCGKLGWLEADPWMIAVAQVNPAQNTPLGSVLVPQPRSNNMSVAYQSPNVEGMIRLWV